MLNYTEVQDDLRNSPRRWLVTGCAGFIGSNICLKLLELGQEVTGLDNMSTGVRLNIDEIKAQYPNFEFIEGDIRDLDILQKAVHGKDHVLHQAALGSVPRSIVQPLATHDNNVNGLLNMLMACKEEKVPMVYASSSSVYGDEPSLPKVEDKVGTPLSPYAATKAIKELYSKVFASTYGVHVTGLRYFNVFGPRQSPDGPYAAVIPKWLGKILKGELVEIYGDGETSRDFCFLANAVQANIMAAYNGKNNKSGEVYNIAAEKQTSLTQLYNMIVEQVQKIMPDVPQPKLEYKDFRAGDVRHSLAQVTKAQNNLNYHPTHTVDEGLIETVNWFCNNQNHL